MKKLGLIIGFCLLILSVDLNITGAVIGTNIKNNFLFILGLVFFLGSIGLYLSNKSLEAIIIPTGPFSAEKKRTKSAMRSYAHSKDKPYILISGEFNIDSEGIFSNDSQPVEIYKKLREQGLKDSDIIIEGKSKDSLQNFLYSVNKLKKKGINHMKIATDRTQYWRFKLFEDQAKKEGIIDKSFAIKPLYTPLSVKEFVYGVLGYVKDYVRVKASNSLKEASKKKTGSFGSLLKNFFTKK